MGKTHRAKLPKQTIESLKLSGPPSLLAEPRLFELLPASHTPHTMDLFKAAWEHTVENPVSTTVSTVTGVLGGGLLLAHFAGLTTMEHTAKPAGESPRQTAVVTV